MQFYRYRVKFSMRTQGNMLVNLYDILEKAKV